MPQSSSKNSMNHSEESLDKGRIKKLQRFQKKFDLQFNDLYLLNTALTHKSYANEKNHGVEDNERLEFLGDSVIDLVISDYYYRKMPQLNEGELSKIRSSLVSEAGLSRIARALKLGSYILLGRGEVNTGGSDKGSILSNTLEAFVAAVYLDQGFEKVYEIVVNIFSKFLRTGSQKSIFNDYKSRLQELTQTREGCIPQYRVVSTTGPDHNKVFSIEISVGDSVVGTGTGKSKKEAEQDGARKVIKKLQSLEQR